ncbi:MAG: VOC family protein, partial [Brevundimonas sp.]
VTSLSFSGQCRAAFEFYASVLGGEVRAFPYGEAPPGMPVDAKYNDWLMHAWLQVGDQALMGADMPPEFAPNIDKPKNGFDVTVHCPEPAESQRVFEALSAGGTVMMPFAATFWSRGYGSFVDKFGVPWMINTDGDPG